MQRLDTQEIDELYENWTVEEKVNNVMDHLC